MVCRFDGVADRGNREAVFVLACEAHLLGEPRTRAGVWVEPVFLRGDAARAVLIVNWTMADVHYGVDLA